MKYILGIDVGGTKIAAGLVDSKMRVSNLTILQTSQTDLLTQIIDLVSSYKGFQGIGLGMPGQILANGMAVKLPNIPKSSHMNFKIPLEKKFRVPVHIMNDAKAFGLAQAVVGAGKNYKVVAGVVFGTGIGVGITIDQKVYFGKDGLAGEFEHIHLLDGKIIRHYRKAAGVFYNVRQAKKFVETILSAVVLSFNPDIIILGGGWGKLPGMEKLANQITKNVGAYETVTPVKISKLRRPGIIGAAIPLLRR